MLTLGSPGAVEVEPSTATLAEVLSDAGYQTWGASGNPAAGWEKGQVEKNVRDSRHQLLQRMPDPDARLRGLLESRRGTRTA